MESANKIAAALENFSEVDLAYVFGSVARRRAKSSSDLDVAVLLAPTAGPDVLDAIATSLEKVSGRTTDLVDLAKAPPLLAHEIVTSGVLLLARDDVERERFVMRTLARYLDTAHLRRVQEHYLRERVEARNAPAR